jgi:hypothetical protein
LGTTNVSSPDAILIRNMRRCDWTVLPILDEWTAVDVVMTPFEMVYFNAVGIDKCTISSVVMSRGLLETTKRGKSLRL